MTKDVADALVGKKIDVLLWGDHQNGTVVSVNTIDDKVFLRMNLQKGSLGIPMDDIKEWSVVES